VAGAWPLGKKRSEGISTQPSDRQIMKCVASPAVAGVTKPKAAGRSQNVQVMTAHLGLTSTTAAARVARARFELPGSGPMPAGYRVGCPARKLQLTGRRPMRQGRLQGVIVCLVTAVDGDGGP
jgi:hypothetical protein